MSAQGYVLITGASRGIGRSTALALAAIGYDLVLWARSERDLATVAEECRKLGANVIHATVDISDYTSVGLAASQTLSNDGSFSGVILNAGSGVWTDLDALSIKDWNETLDVNLNGSFYTLKACLPLFKNTKYALLVGVLSDSALYPFPDRAAYSSAKTGLYSLLNIARQELRKYETRVSLLFPSRVDTYFPGSHREAGPGTREDALRAEDVAEIIKILFTLPTSVEVREVHLTSIASSFGPFS